MYQEYSDSDIVLQTLVDQNTNQQLNIRTPYVTRTVTIQQQQRIPLYVNGKLKSEQELAQLNIHVKSYTKLQRQQIYFTNLYAQDAQGDKALQLRVRQYKAYLDQLGLSYSVSQDTIMSAIQQSDMTDAWKATVAMQMKAIYDAITTNLQFYGSQTPHKDTYNYIAKLIQYLPEVAE